MGKGGQGTRYAAGVAAPTSRLATAPPSHRRGGAEALLFLAVVAVVAGVWRPVLASKAVYLDDPEYVARNDLIGAPSLRSAATLLREALAPSTVGGYYHPLAMISLMLDYAAGGRLDDLRAFHRTSLALHLLNTLLVMMLVRMLLGDALAAAVAGLLFGLHPQAVESVAWVASRKNLLATTFALGCLIAHVRYARGGGWFAYGAGLLALAAALLSKPSTVPLPVLLLVLDFWPLGRFGTWRAATLEKTPHFLLAAASAVVTYVSQSATAFTTLPGSGSESHRVFTVLHNLAFYPLKYACPVALSAHYPEPATLGPAHPMVLAALIGGPVVAALLLVLARRGARAPLAAALFFLAGVLPTLGIVGFTNTIAADRFAYLPGVGLVLAAAALVAHVRRRCPNRTPLALAACALLATGAGWQTRRGLDDWRDTPTLFERLLARAPRAELLLLANYADVLTALGRFDEALAVYRRALAADPASAPYYAAAARGHLAGHLAARGDEAEALALHREALRIGASPETLNNFAWFLATARDARLRDGVEAVRLAELAARPPNDARPEFLDTLAAAYAEAGRFPEAVRTARLALAHARAAARRALADDLERCLRAYEAGQRCH